MYCVTACGLEFGMICEPAVSNVMITVIGRKAFIVFVQQAGMAND
jgi:hypothetical protein